MSEDDNTLLDQQGNTDGDAADDTLLTNNDADNTNEGGGSDEGTGDDANNSQNTEGDGGDDAGGNENHGAPEGDYEDFSIEEGKSFDDALLGEFKTTAKELGLSQVGAQKLVDMFGAHQNSVIEQNNEVINSWRSEIQNDPNGEKLVSDAKQVLKQFGNEDLIQIVSNPQLGLGNHPGFIRFLAAMKGRVTEDNFDSSNNESGDKPAERDIAVDMYPSMAKK